MSGTIHVIVRPGLVHGSEHVVCLPQRYVVPCSGLGNRTDRLEESRGFKASSSASGVTTLSVI